MDAADMQFDAEFDAAFSNATLHWVLDKEQAARAIFRALKPGGRFAGEMGGEGNLAQLREALDEELIIRGYRAAGRGEQLVCRRPRNSPRSMKPPASSEIDARLIERPTPIEHGVAAWVTTFRRAGSTAPACPRTSAPRSAPPSPTASAPTSPIMSAFASS